MADAIDPRDIRPDGHEGEDDEYEEEPEISLTKLINANNEMIQGLKQQLARAKKRMMEGT